jgi:hypothetical protein
MTDFCTRAVLGPRVPVILAVWFCAGGGALGQTSPATEAMVYNRPSLLIANDKLEVAVVKQGGAMVRVLIQGDAGGVSPFGNPELVPQVPENRKLQGPMVGHFVCVDGFGPPSAEERAAGLAMHGEAYLQPWKLTAAEKQGATTTMRFAVDLPLLHETFTRALRMVDGESVVYVDSELASELAFDRTVNWGEHPYLFPPFIEAGKTVVDISGTRSRTRTYTSPERRPLRLRPSQEFTWPLAPADDGTTLELRTTPANVDWMAHTTTLMDPSRRLAWVTVMNTSRHYLLGYVFRREEFPWLQQFMNYPTNGWQARAVEFATQPFDLPRRDMVELNRMYDTPVYRWLPAKSKITTRFLLFYVKSPEGMTRVDDVRLEGGRIIVEDRASGKTLTLAASQPL